MSKKVKYTLEYPVRCSPGILYEFLSTSTGLQEWFAEKVEDKDGLFSFAWNGSSEEAEVMESEENKSDPVSLDSILQKMNILNLVLKNLR